MSHRSPKRPGPRRARLASLLALVALPLAGCFYSFTGGGLPAHVRTVYIDAFDDQTPYGLSTEVQRALQNELPRTLGVRLAPQATADAIVRGRITAYDDVPANARPGQEGRVDVLASQIRIAFEAEIYDLKQDRVLWKPGSLSVQGEYNPNREQPQDGRTRAVKLLVEKVTQGAQSQW